MTEPTSRQRRWPATAVATWRTFWFRPQPAYTLGLIRLAFGAVARAHVASGIDRRLLRLWRQGAEARTRVGTCAPGGGAELTEMLAENGQIFKPRHVQ